MPNHLRGTFAGLAHPELIKYLHSLGITAVELMPVHAFVDDRFLVDHGLRNFWGYNTLCFFAPEPRYLSSGDLAEFKTMIKQLHDAGIEVLLDVVYNHTAEGDQIGPASVSGALTTPPTTDCGPRTAVTTSTTRAAATRSTSRTRGSCRW